MRHITMQMVLAVGFAVGASALALTAGQACTPAERAVVRSVVDLVDEVCGDKDTVDECLGKAQAKRASMRHEPADAGAGD